MNSSHHRIAIGSVFTECNQFGGMVIDMSWFERYELRRGKALLQSDAGVLGGMLQVLREHQADVVPLVYASTCPGGLLSSGCYAQLKAELLGSLRTAIPVHGVLLPLHGGAAAEDVDDLEGDLISAVREVVGPAVPIVATLDLHAHVTAAMVAAADALLAWETYPHRDSFSTGGRGAKVLLDTLEGRCRPTMAMAKVPVITSAVRASTEDNGTFARIMRFAKRQEGRGNVVSTSVFLAHFALDQPDLGSGGLVVTNDDREGAVSLALRIAEQYWTGRFELEPETWDPDEAIARGLELEGGPVVLVEAADCIGGGAAGDSVATLRALLAAEVAETALVPVVDPQAAAACHGAGAGREVTLDLGHRSDPQWGLPHEGKRPGDSPQRWPLSLRRRDVGWGGRANGAICGIDDWSGSDTNHLSSYLRLDGRAVQLRATQPGNRQVRRRQEPDELSVCLWRQSQRDIHSGYARSHTSYGQASLLQKA